MYYDKAKGLWREQMTIGGKRKVFSGKTKKDVKLKILSAQHEQKQLPTFGATALRWKEHHQDMVEPGSWRSYDAPLRRAIQEFGLRRLDDIKPGEIQAWINNLGFAYKTACNQKTVISEVFRFAIVDEGLDISNPCDQIRVSEKLSRTTRRALEDWEIAEIRKTKADEFLLAPLILYTGARCGEALALQKRDIDFDRKVIHICKAVHHEGNQPFLGRLKTEMSDRHVPLLPQLEALIIQLDLDEDDFIVSGPELLTYRALAYRWERWCQAHAVRFDRHSIRHAYATALLESDVSVKGAQAFLGHSNFKTTMDTYTHIREKFLDAEAEKLRGHFGQIG